MNQQTNVMERPSMSYDANERGSKPINSEFKQQAKKNSKELTYRIYIYTLMMIIVGAAIYLSNRYIQNPHGPGDVFGIKLGILGSAMMILMHVYSLRKKLSFMKYFGSLRYWLGFHIFLGILGPILIMFHTAFKVGGIVSISFWSMVVVVLSGFVGRYIYVQIPRGIEGKELTLAELESENIRLMAYLNKSFANNSGYLQKVEKIFALSNFEQKNMFQFMFQAIGRNFEQNMLIHSLRKELKRNKKFSSKVIDLIIATIRSQAELKRKIVFLDLARKLFLHWHRIHTPFAVTMYVIMVIHIIVVFMFGFNDPYWSEFFSFLK